MPGNNGRHDFIFNRQMDNSDEEFDSDFDNEMDYT